MQKHIIFSAFVMLILSYYVVQCSDADISILNRPSSSDGDKEVNSCPFVYKSRVSSAQDGLVNCTWYSSNACCKRTEVTSVFSGMFSLYTPDSMDVAKAKHCRNLLNYMMCYFCDPKQADWYTTTLHICDGFCSDVHTYCGEAEYQGVTIGEKFSTGEEFCQSQMFNVIPGADNCFKFDPTVFDSSIVLVHSTVTLIACMIFYIL